MGLEENSMSRISIEKLAFASFLSFIFFFGICGNVLILQFYSKKHQNVLSMSTNNEFHIYCSICLIMIHFNFHFAVANILFLCTIPFNIVEKFNNGQWIFSPFICQVYQTVLFFNYSVTIWFLLLKTISIIFLRKLDHKTYFEKYRTKQSVVLHRLCYSTTKIVSLTTFLPQAFPAKKKSRFLRLSMQLFEPFKPYAPKITIAAYMISVLTTMPVFAYSDTDGYGYCTCSYLLYSDSKKEIAQCENLRTAFPDFEYDCPRQRCIREQDFFDFQNAAENFFQSKETNNTVSHGNNSTTMTSFDILMTFPSALVDNIAEFTVVENYSNLTFQESCTDDQNRAGVFLKLYRWYNITCIFVVTLAMVICFRCRVKKLKSVAIQLTGNKPRLLRNSHELNSSIKQNIKQLKKDLLFFKEHILTVTVFTVFWFFYHIVEICKLHLFFSLSENDCKILTNISQALIYAYAGLSSYIFIIYKKREFTALLMRRCLSR